MSPLTLLRRLTHMAIRPETFRNLEVLRRKRLTYTALRGPATQTETINTLRLFPIHKTYTYYTLRAVAGKC